MQGTGTAENPYIIMTAEDLYAMGDSGGSDVYFSLGRDIDFNNMPYAENFQPIPLNCKNFSGNNHTIRNINYSTTQSNANIFNILCDNIVIENLKTENIRLVGKTVFLFANSGEKRNMSLKHCTLLMNDIIIISASSASVTNRCCILHANNIKISAEYCTFAVKMQSEKSYPLLALDNASCCQIKAEIRLNSSANSGNAYIAFISDSVITDSYFFVKIKIPEAETSGTFDFSSTNSKFSSSYLVCEPSAEIATLNWNGDMRSTCFYDSTIAKKNNSSIHVRNNLNSVNFYSLNTEQCKNPVYLRSIGFNCAGADE